MNYKLWLNSIRFKMVFLFLAFTLPLNALLILNNNYAIGVVRNQVAQSNKNLVSLYMGQIDRSLEEADKYLYNLAAVNTDLLAMELTETNNSQRYYAAKIRLSNTISADIHNYKPMDMFFVYSAVNRDLLTTQYANTSYEMYEMNQRINNNIRQIFQDGQLPGNDQNDQWLIRKIGENYYLCHIVKVGTAYIGAWVNVKNLMVPLNLVDLGQKGKAVLITEDKEPMDHSDFISENKISLSYGQNFYNLTGDKEKFLVVGEISKRGKFSLIAVIPDSTILEKLPYLQKILSFIPILSVFIMLAYLVLLRKVILRPISKITAAMRRIKSADLEVRIALNATSNEFDLMNRTFNSMVSQIQDLKIQVYEEQINQQKAELKHLQLQINPHFFLNSLNVIYQLAQVGDFSLIQEMSYCLIEYFRFMFRSNLTFVLLEDEIKHTRNYLKIQEMRFPDQLTCRISVPEYLLKYMVPPLLVQTFVENTIKHAVTMDHPIHISIDILLEGSLEEPRIQMLIQDTGKGFPKDLLQKLQSETNNVNEQGEHIGIWNVQRRLRLLYKGKARLMFSNRPERGACVEINLPLKMENKDNELYS